MVLKSDWQWIPLSALLTLITFGCAKPRTQVVLMPDAKGHVGVIDVETKKGHQMLDTAHQSVEIKQLGGVILAPSEPQVLSEREIQNVFGAAIAAQPKEPLNFILQFESGSTNLMESSIPLISTIIEKIRQRASLDVSVVGHTDTAGSDELNNRLSRERADCIAKQLVAAGVDARILEITSHGKSVLLVPTGDNVPEPKNRRVEVTVR